VWFRISLHRIGRRFNRDWIFRGIDYTFEQNYAYAILGPNGSGKSTLLQVIAGSLAPSEGKLIYASEAGEVAHDRFFSRLSLAAPYLELIEELTLREQIQFHFRFKHYRDGLSEDELLSLLNIPFPDRPIRNFSSGMKQRTKLILAFCADTPVLLLDEPTANLDNEGIDWYLRMVERFAKDRITIIGSNQEHEYRFCHNRLSVTDYKK
jgi:ABC-type multidrug transport system ATPase subunit